MSSDSPPRGGEHGKWKMEKGRQKRRRAPRSFHFPFTIFHFPFSSRDHADDQIPAVIDGFGIVLAKLVEELPGLFLIAVVEVVPAQEQPSVAADLAAVAVVTVAEFLDGT